MKYVVDWEQRAVDELAAVWLAAADRAAITRAARELEAALGRDPLGMGESRQSSLQRVASRAGLGIEFDVIEDDRRVVVRGVFAVKS